ncbi:MAG: recombination regulator RecX [Rhodocyclaceae bacterium]|jgi:regulatory protein|nr:recombination regulator RecX [Rhodocyclaceae bacterium]
MRAGSSLRERAIRLLAQREHSRAELERKLAPHGSAQEIEETVDRMTELGLLSDQRFAEAWVRSHAARFGTARLRHDLAQRGVARELIDAALNEVCPEDDLDRARAVWRSRFGQPPADLRERAKQGRFLQARGFAPGVIARLLREVGDEPA